MKQFKDTYQKVKVNGSSSDTPYFNVGLSFYPEVSFHEIRKYKQLVLEKSGLSDEEYIKLLATLLARINLVPLEQIQENIKEANSLIGKRDINDVVFLATALNIEGSKIWSNDKDYDEQTKVVRFDTQKLLELFDMENEKG